MRHHFLLSILLLLTANASAQTTPETLHYLGTLNTATHIALTLTTDTDNSVTATCLDTTAGIETYLEGSRDPHTFTLADADTPAATLHLSLNPDRSLTGTWNSANGSCPSPISLTFVARSAAFSTSKSHSYTVETQYPLFPPTTPFYDALNHRLQREARLRQRADLKTMESRARKEDADAPLWTWSFHNTPQILYADGSLVSIRTMHDTYSGGLHNFYTYSAETFTWKHHHLISLRPTALLILSPATRRTLATSCITALTEKNAAWPNDAQFTRSLPTFNITPTSLLITFDPYKVGSFAQGAFTVPLSYDSLRSFIPNSSPLMRSINHNLHHPSKNNLCKSL